MGVFPVATLRVAACTGSTSERAVQALYGRDRLKKALVPVENAGDPTGAVTPEFIGQFCHDTSNDDLYWAHGLANTNWKICAT